MFKVEFYRDGRSWYGLNFEFDSMEEAQKFIQTALAHFIKKDDEDESEEDVLIASIKYSQKFTTAEEEENESSISD